jgi:hypothetical protein
LFKKGFLNSQAVRIRVKEDQFLTPSLPIVSLFPNWEWWILSPKLRKRHQEA